MDENVVTTREIDLGILVRRLMGEEWNKPHVEYEFSNGRKFVRKTEDSYEDE